MSERANILGRIREALTLTAPQPGAHDSHSHAKRDMPTSSEFRQWLPPVQPSLDEQLALFAEISVDLKTYFQVFASETELHIHLRQLASAENWQRIATHRTVLTQDAVLAMSAETYASSIFYTDAGYDVHELEKCDVGITGCDALVAQTGSVLVSTRSAGGRALSVLPPHHVVIARRSQMLPDLTAALDFLQASYSPDYPSYSGFITGPSRTGDIERILVLGAHGPKKLTVLVF